MDNTIHIKDKVEIKERQKAAIQDTRVSVYVDGIPTPVYVGRNKVIVPGSAFGMAKFFNKSPKIWTPTYNQLLRLENSTFEAYDKEGLRREEEVILFAISDDGCETESRQVLTVPYTKWVEPNKLIPFRYKNADSDISVDDRLKYFGRKIEDTGKIAYYFKAFEAEPEVRQQFTDGTPIDENIYMSQREDEVESFVRLRLRVNKQDLREYFESKSIEERRVSSIELLTGYATEYTDSKTGLKHTYYQNIRPLTRYHFSREYMEDPEKGLTIIYDMFF